MSDERIPGELLAIQREGRRKAAEQNTGAPCEVCGSKQPRLSIQRRPDGGVFVGISYEIPADKAKAELKALRGFLKGFEDGSPEPPKRGRR